MLVFAFLFIIFTVPVNSNATTQPWTNITTTANRHDFDWQYGFETPVLCDPITYTNLTPICCCDGCCRQGCGVMRFTNRIESITASYANNPTSGGISAMFDWYGQKLDCNCGWNLAQVCDSNHTCSFYVANAHNGQDCNISGNNEVVWPSQTFNLYSDTIPPTLVLPIGETINESGNNKYVFNVTWLDTAGWSNVFCTLDLYGGLTNYSRNITESDMCDGIGGCGADSTYISNTFDVPFSTFARQYSIGTIDCYYDNQNNVSTQFGYNTWIVDDPSNSLSNSSSINIMVISSNTSLTLTASIGWSIPKGYSNTLTCTADNGESTPIIYVDGINYTNPYTFTPQTAVTVICNCSDTAHYYGASISNMLNVTITGTGGSSPPPSQTNVTPPSTTTQATLPPTDKLARNVEKIIEKLPFLTEEEKQYIIAFLRAIYHLLIATILGIPVYFILILLALLIFMASVADKREIRTWRDIPNIGIFSLFIATFLGVIFFLGPLVEV